jgi:hypothetical protein
MAFPFLKKAGKVPFLSEFPLRVYPAAFSFDRLSRGVDNVRHDVHISPAFHNAAGDLALALVAQNLVAAKPLFSADKSAVSQKKLEFKRLFSQIMAAAVDKAKVHKEIQIDYLAQVAAVKVVQTEIALKWQTVARQIRAEARERELAGGRRKQEAAALREEYNRLVAEKQTLLRQAGREMFTAMAEIQDVDMRDLREATFGREQVIPLDFFKNPMIYFENRTDPFFMMEEYVLLGHRTGDTHRYDSLLEVVRGILYRLDGPEKGAVTGRLIENLLGRQGLTLEYEGGLPDEAEINIDSWIKEVDNIDVLFNHYLYEREYEENRREGNIRQLYELSRTIEAQRRLLNLFYSECRKKGLVDLAAAYFTLKPLYKEFCPPLMPHKLLEYILEPRSRKPLKERIEKLNKVYSREVSLDTLDKAVLQIRKMGREEKRQCLVRFARRFARYHRDVQNFVLLKDAMDSLSVTSGDKTLILSRANNTLYEFCLPHEEVQEERPIINHVILKADVRGSTDITYEMKQRGLNPASYFSLNLFDPISQMLPEYGAQKEFIEGDAIILSVFEREASPRGWYSVARCCGLAIRILSVLQRYNLRNRKNGLPAIEVGIGIAHEDSPPMFLFDQTNRIMISPAINHADRLSACHKEIRKHLAQKKGLFNLYVFQAVSDTELAATADDLLWRYNVNGIELSESAFDKLRREIMLKTVSGVIPEFGERALTLHFGKFPTVSGRYQPLVIREGHVPMVGKETLSALRFTFRKYYEVCTHNRLYEYANSLVG